MIINNRVQILFIRFFLFAIYRLLPIVRSYFSLNPINVKDLSGWEV